MSEHAFPLFLRLSGRDVLLVGGGPVALEKGRALHVAGATVRVVSPTIEPELHALASSVEERPFRIGDIDGAWLVIAAATPEVNEVVKNAADERRIFVVAIDDLAHCSAFGAAHLRRGPVSVAISSDGRAPALVVLLRKALDALLVEDVAEWASLGERARQAWKEARVPLCRRTPLLLAAINDLYSAEGS
jgi:siroheme synthase-like protein